MLAKYQQIINKEMLLKDINDKDLSNFCIYANAKYRAGEPIISDEDYDFVFLAELKNRNPQHPFLQEIEAENIDLGTQKLLLPQVMLSTDKAFSLAEIQKWLTRVEKSAIELNLNIEDIIIKTTPKLDGFAAFDDGKILYTRGDGKKGSDISRVFARGLLVFKGGNRGLGAGEIVVQKSYFDKYLADEFEHSRNFQASIIREKELNNLSKAAIKAKAVFFVPFVLLPSVKTSIKNLILKFDTLVQEMLISVDFDVDGVIFEVQNPELKQAMGANRKFHRWMIAYKENKEKAQVKVLKVEPQVGRTGKITPVARLTPTKLSGAIISNASCYHYNFIKQQRLGAGSIVEIIRSGLVIPKITQVLKPTSTEIPTNCPSCGDILQWQSDFLVCINQQKCEAQISSRLEYFFAILANNDGFGEATIKKLFNYGVDSLTKIYNLDVESLQKMGFGEKTATNLVDNLTLSQTTQIEDYRFLSAFGVERLGLGNSENLLKHYDLNTIFTLTIAQIASIEGFAELSAKAIVVGLNNIKEEFTSLFKLGFNLEKTVKKQDTADNYFSNKKLVFSGAMQQSRQIMEKEAKNNGAIVQKAISAKTDCLIIGEKVGASKLAKAQKLGVEIISEARYLELLANS